MYTRVYSTPVLCRLLPFFSEGYVPIPWWSHPRVFTLCALGYLHCMLWGAYTMSSGGMATMRRMDSGGHLQGDAQGWGAYAYLCPYYI